MKHELGNADQEGPYHLHVQVLRRAGADVLVASVENSDTVVSL